MNKKDLINEVCYKTKLTKKEIDMVLTSTLEIIVAKVSQGERVRFVGFGSFYKFTKKFALQSVNSIDLSEISIAKFSPGKFFKQRINVQN
jgi:DNA-binding protein HU-beta